MINELKENAQQRMGKTVEALGQALNRSEEHTSEPQSLVTGVQTCALPIS